MIQEIKNTIVIGVSVTLFAVANLVIFYMLEGMPRWIMFVLTTGLSFTMLVSHLVYLDFKKKSI